MPDTLPAPCDRYGGVVPPCPQLPAAISEAEEYVRRAEGWLAQAIENGLSDPEQEILFEAAIPLRRLAES